MVEVIGNDSILTVFGWTKPSYISFLFQPLALPGCKKSSVLCLDLGWDHGGTVMTDRASKKLKSHEGP
jgi:hypothetical protein